MGRRMHRAPVAPRLEVCEARTLMTGYNGVNIDGNWTGATADMWVDLAKTMSPWGQPNGPWNANPSLKLNAQGYPLADAAVDTIDVAAPNGIYKLSYQGSATLTVWGTGKVIGPVVKGADGVTRADVQLTHTGANPINITFTNVNPADPPRNLHLIEPGYNPNTTQVFTNAFLQRLQPFSTLRFMEMTSTNGNPQVNWSDRTKPDNFLQTNSVNGVAYEYLAELANEANKDVWINVPALASDDYVKNLADLLRDKVHAGAKIYVEYSNENWNGSFPQYNQILNVANANPKITATDSWTKIAQQSAFRLKQIGDIFRQEFGANSGQVKPVYAGFQGAASWGQAGLAFVNSLYGDPSKYFSGLAMGTYYQPSIDLTKSGVTLSQLFVNLSSNISGNLVNNIASNKSVADLYHLPLMSYEGGPALVSKGNANAQNLINQARNDPRMGDLTRQFIAAWDNHGGGLGEYYKFISPSSQYGDWGMLNDNLLPGSPKWDALMGKLLHAGDATLNGTVDYNDFTVLKKNFNGTGTYWWQQGDSNGDHKVNQADLQLLRANLGTVTPAQAAEIALFNAPTAATVGQSVTVNAGGRDGALYYNWTVIGGGTVGALGTPNSSGAQFTFTPGSPGRFLVYLTISNPSGTFASSQITITVPGTVASSGVTTLGGVVNSGNTRGLGTSGTFVTNTTNANVGAGSGGVTVAGGLSANSGKAAAPAGPLAFLPTGTRRVPVVQGANSRKP